MVLLSKNKIKYIHSLELKKIRKEERVFLAEGPKLVGDLLGHFPCCFLAATASWIQEHPDLRVNEIAEVSQEDLSRASLLKTPQQVLAVFEQPQYTLTPGVARHSLCLALDGSALNILFVRKTQWMFIIPRPYKPLWGGLRG